MILEAECAETEGDFRKYTAHERSTLFFLFAIYLYI